MTVVAVTADNLRIEDCENATGFASIGGGAGASAEAPFAYQGSLLVNRKVTSSTGAGFQYVPTNDSGSITDMTATRRKTWMVKCMVSDYGGLDSTDGVLVRIGSSSGNYFAYILAGTDAPGANFAAYRDIGGLLVIPVDPNESANYNDVGKDAGTPTLTSIDYFALVAAFSSSSAKNENVGLDAIDVGSGLYLVNGTGADPEGTWQDFPDFDGNTVANRFGFARNADGGGILAFGELRIGTANDTTAVATEFDDRTSVITWLDHLAGAGFSVVAVDVGHASSVVTDGALHIGAGDLANTDSRPDYTVKGTAAPFNFIGTLRNFRVVTLTASSTVDSGATIECAEMNLVGATLDACTIRTNALTSVACLLDPVDFANLSNVAFIQTGAGHAIQIDSVGSYDLDAITFTGYGADTTDAAAIDVTATSGTVTLNIVNGGSTPTFKTAGATVVINNNVSVTFVNLTVGSEVRIYLAGTNSEVAGIEATVGSTFAFSVGAGVLVDYVVLGSITPAPQWVPIRVEVTSFATSQSVLINQQIDRNFAA